MTLRRLKHVVVPRLTLGALLTHPGFRLDVAGLPGSAILVEVHIADPEVLLVFHDPSFPWVPPGQSPPILPCARRPLYLAHEAGPSLS